ncbi:M48 family metallopeptidase [Hymenobacter negativus]|uniref:M48 family metallopeptidase n=1 Tax=Hymenobacter negativus TaxID=2795026 RepID=A0ABS3QBL7_9BACT|nr:M48 family metallopeptidase [Hymenobacter negativus]MBO2008645.1 M48 family metallopeptidase [Hymenobacter negativus]
MTREAFVARLEHLHPLAVADPGGYRWRVRGWALLGYGFILLLLLGTVGTMLGVLALLAFGTAVALLLKVGLLLGFFAWKVLRSLWVKFDPPQGRALTPDEAAPLFDELRQQARAMAAPPVHRVLLTTDFNAAIVQLPRLGVLGWPRNYLMVGLPLLQALSPEQAAAVVAHELGHLRGGHGKFSAWVYRVGQSWEQLMGQMERNRTGTWLSKFADWYVPRFNAWSHPLRRADEFEADAAAGRVTSPQALAQALCALVVRDSALDKLHWDVVTASIAAQPYPPTDAISRLLPLAKSARLDDTTEGDLLKTALAADPDVFDTHPVLLERLTALRQQPAVPAPPTVTAAEVWFGAGLPALAAELDTAWALERESFWKERHQFLSTQQQRLRTLNERRAAGGILSPDEAWEHADLTEDHASPAEALPLFQALFEDKEHGLGAKFTVGRMLTLQDDPAGLALLDEVMAQVPSARASGLLLQQAYHQRRGDKAEARRLQTETLRHADRSDVAQAERDNIRPTDHFLPHGLPADSLTTLSAQLAEYSTEIKRVWLLRKELTQFVEHPLYVLVVEQSAGRSVPDATSAALAQKLAGALTMPGESFIIPLTKSNDWLDAPARRLPETLVYPGIPG